VEATGWSGLFAVAFRQSRNPMTLVDEQRRHVDVNGAYLRLIGYKRENLIGRPIWEFVAGGPLLSQEQWAAALATRRFTGEAGMVCRDGRQITIQWGAGTEVVTGRRLVLFVALGSGARRFTPERPEGEDREPRPLSKREKEVVRYVALGYTGPEIASELHISHDTVRTHVRNAMEKTGARSRAHLVAKVLGNGIALA
jgi:PAS domain S-box-containing protein